MSRSGEVLDEARETRLRESAIACIRAGIRAVDPARLVAEALPIHLQIGPGGAAAARGRVLMVAAGKAAQPMADGARSVLGEEGIAQGMVVAPSGSGDEGDGGVGGSSESSVSVESLTRIRRFPAAHPVPTAANVRAAREARALVRSAERDDLVLLLLSGGASSLLTLPPDELDLDAVREVTDLLLRAGAPIREMNAVRKHLDLVKGGWLAREAAPARVLALALSDVVGDPLDVIASGPASPDPSTYWDAIAVLDRHVSVAGAAVRARRYLEAGARGAHPETPKPGDPCFRGVRVKVVGNGRLAAEAALGEAERRGFSPFLLTTLLEGEARDAGGFLAAVGREAGLGGSRLALPACIVTAGETTVTVRGQGRGGRNQELALGAALALDGTPGIVVASAGTDGIDGPTDAAGAIATGTTVSRAARLRLDPRAALARNDSHPFFAALGDLIRTGPTGTNVADLQVVLVDRVEGDRSGRGTG